MSAKWTKEKPTESGRYLYRFDAESPVFIIHLYDCYEDAYCGLRALLLDHPNKADDMMGEWSERMGNAQEIT